jgi:hypothetical protein
MLIKVKWGRRAFEGRPSQCRKGGKAAGQKPGTSSILFNFTRIGKEKTFIGEWLTFKTYQFGYAQQD